MSPIFLDLDSLCHEKCLPFTSVNNHATGLPTLIKELPHLLGKTVLAPPSTFKELQAAKPALSRSAYVLSLTDQQISDL